MDDNKPKGFKAELTQGREVAGYVTKSGRVLLELVTPLNHPDHPESHSMSTEEKIQKHREAKVLLLGEDRVLTSFTIGKDSAAALLEILAKLLSEDER